jgi:hypothetical protein
LDHQAHQAHPALLDLREKQEMPELQELLEDPDLKDLLVSMALLVGLDRLANEALMEHQALQVVLVYPELREQLV